MTNPEIQRKTDNIATFLEKKRLKDVFSTIAELVTSLNDWSLKEELERTETTYKYMLQYMVKGADDPNRQKVYNDLLRNIYELADKTTAQLRKQDDNRYYYQSKRNLSLTPLLPYQDMVSTLEDIASQLSLSELLEDAQTQENAIARQKELENISIQLFKKVWLSSLLTEEESNILRGILQSNLLPLQSQILLVSALILSLQEGFDKEKILLLLDAYEQKEEEINQRALVGLLLILYAYNKRLHLYPTIGNRIQHLAENIQFPKDIHNIIKQFIQTKETEKISKKIRDELIPEMMKISPKISQKINLEDLIDQDSLEDKNPEWKDILEEAGLSDKLQEISELQMEGADIMHSSFSSLKTYPFFYELSNWFLPFTASHSELSELRNSDFEATMTSLAQVGHLCNSDKYSLFFTFLQMPASYRKMMSSQMISDAAEMMKQQNEAAVIPQAMTRAMISNQYIHDLYRFYKVHPRRTDFEDIFASPLSFHKAENIWEIIADPQMRLSIGEYYFIKNQFADAAELFEQLTGQEQDDAILFQKIGYCRQMMGQTDEALQAYLKSELIATNSNLWTMKKIAACHRILKQPQEALSYYQKVEALTPDNLSVQLNIGHCYLELKQYKEALKTYFKVEYLSKDSAKAWRPIAWCSFLTGKMEQAVQYYERILSTTPEMSDFLNFGHVLLATKNNKEAIKQYKSAILSSKSSKEKFLEAFYADVPELLLSGVAEEDIPILLDQVFYAIEE